MNEKPVKLNMGFDEALKRLARTPKKAIDAVEQERKEAQKMELAVETLRTAPPKEGGAAKSRLN